MPAASANLLQKKTVFKYSKCYATFDMTKYLDVVCLQKNQEESMNQKNHFYCYIILIC